MSAQTQQAWDPAYGDRDVRLRDRCVCQYCGLDGSRNFEIWMNLTIDHLVPAVPPDERNENKVVACYECNSIKRQYMPQGDTLAQRLADARRYVRKQRDSQRQEFWEFHDRMPL